MRLRYLALFVLTSYSCFGQSAAPKLIHTLRGAGYILEAR